MLSTPRTMKRREKQLAFYESNENIVIGDILDLPIGIDEIMAIDKDSTYVEDVFDSGLSAIVYKIKIDGNYYTLKKVRKKILVENIDGQTSFLNEVQKRKILLEAKIKEPDLYDGIVETLFADFRKGVILSKWIEGQEISFYNEAIFDHLFKTLFAMMKAGVFENDPTTGNIICKDDHITLFDFGYAYDMNPLEDLNMEGFDTPVLHPAERLESRAFMIHLFDIESIHGKDKACQLFALEKKVASKHYKEYAKWLKVNNANGSVIDYFMGFAERWDQSLERFDSTLSLYETKKFESFLIDVIDDISGKSCTPDTIIKADMIYDSLKDNYHQLLNDGALAFEGLSRFDYEELLSKFEEFKSLVRKYQQDNLEGFNQWKKNRIKSIAESYVD